MEISILAIQDTGTEVDRRLEKGLQLRLAVDAIEDIEQRIEILKRLEEFKRDPPSFRARFESGQERTQARILKARENLSGVSIQVEAIRKISELVVEYNLDNESFKSLTKTLIANTAYGNRMWATTDDLVEAGRLVIEQLVMKRQKKRKGPVKEEVKKVKERALEDGLNYLIYEEKTMKTYEVFIEVLEDGIPGLCITTVFPKKLAKTYDLSKAEVYWLSEAKGGEGETLNPKRLDFEVMRTIDRFMRNHDKSIILIDGFEHLVMENGFDSIMKFTKKVNDMAAMHNSSMIIPMNPESLESQRINILKKEFDKVKNYL